jgi:aryl-alcohol dehydrogenase-like predicted oxidoreductase
METRIFGRTGHASTVAIFGAAAFWEISQEKAEAVMETALEAGINHIDVAPSYGQAEERLGPFLERHPGRFFIGCKTMERSKEGAAAEMRRSLERLYLEAFDLYQFHAVTRFEELDDIFRPGGALEAVLEARQQGLLRFIGITGHGVDTPAIFREALRRFDFDSVLFPLNFVQYANPYYRENAEALLAECEQRQVGTMIIKSITKGPWGEHEKTHTTWYEPFADEEMIQKSVNFVLSQKVTGLCTAGDVKVLPLVIQACERFAPMSEAEQEKLIASAGKYEPLFV